MAISIQHTIRSIRVQPVALHTTGERVFATLGDQYQALAMDLEGEPLWGLRVAWPLPPYPERTKESMREQAERYEVDPDTLEFPEHYVAVNASRLDGRGRLHIFPNHLLAAAPGRPRPRRSPAAASRRSSMSGRPASTAFA